MKNTPTIFKNSFDSRFIIDIYIIKKFRKLWLKKLTKMTELKPDKTELLNKLNDLYEKQAAIQKELAILHRQIQNIPTDNQTVLLQNDKIEAEKISEGQGKSGTQQKFIAKEPAINKLWSNARFGYGFEKFIGENLINKIGIAVLIIGVGIGVKYAIDNDLISPLVRIILGYLVGATLIFFAVRLYKKLVNFSAVLFSGAMAINYYITFAAQAYYNLFPQLAAIIILIIITVATVGLAISYNKQVIAHIGLVGAYIIPYILKEPFSNVITLFIYMAIINTGILCISTVKKWKPLNFVSLIATWSIFETWFIQDYQTIALGVSLTFLTIFFIIFHLVFLSYKLILKEKFAVNDIIFLLVNAAVLFFTGYNAIDIHESAKLFLGLFVFTNAVVFLVTSFVVYKVKSDDRQLLLWNIGLALTLITIAIPVQFNNKETAILWALEAMIIFGYGKIRQSNFYTNISYVVLLVLFFISIGNWASVHYNFYSFEVDHLITPVFNFQFLSALITLSAFLFINLGNQSPKLNQAGNSNIPEVAKILLPLALLMVIYFTFYNEISIYWNNRQVAASFTLNDDGIWTNTSRILNTDIADFKKIWLLNYSILVAVLFSAANHYWVKSISFGALFLIMKMVLVLVTLTAFMFWTGQLNESYLHPANNSGISITSFHIVIRFIGYLFLGLMLYSTYKFLIPEFKAKFFGIFYEIVLCLCIVRISSGELINWMGFADSDSIYKHGLSILWGAISLLFVAYGIWKRKKHLRVAGIVLLGATLIKLFFYDLTNLETLPKTLVFVLTGVLLLIVSYLYNKYTSKIFSPNESEKA